MPAPTARRTLISKRAIHRVHQRLTARIEPDSDALPIHRVTERHPRDRIGETDRTTHAYVPERLLREDDAVLVAGSKCRVVGRLLEPGRPPGGYEHRRVDRGCRSNRTHGRELL